MVESFSGHSSQHIRLSLPHIQCGVRFSRTIFSSVILSSLFIATVAAYRYCCCKPACSMSAVCSHQYDAGKTIPIDKLIGWGKRRLFSFHLCCGLVRKPNLICERNTFGILPNCQ
ncbi:MULTISPECIES: hypothetical protein [Dickeya]|uniref:hypothetical protein n=1 Tax=Dickeya TaxID=204037 RepID=UPI000AEB672E|nr:MULTISPECIES: hypothetical protein [Dickeya]